MVLGSRNSVSSGLAARDRHNPGGEVATSTSLSDRDFRTIAALVHGLVGIKMTDAKKAMVASRLLRRLRALKLSNYSQYCEHLRTPEGGEQERRHLLDLLTTHKTEFFREPAHFDVIRDRVLPDLAQRGSAGLRVWSAGCSTGQEVYTLAMVLTQETRSHRSLLDGFSILGTDVSPECVRKAELAIYTETEIADIPAALRSEFLLRSKDTADRKFRFRPEVRSHTTFRTLNFMDRHWNVESADVVFCRNVLIYFSPESQHAILGGLCRHLKPNGYLFISHSETLPGSDLPLAPVARSVFRKT